MSNIVPEDMVHGAQKMEESWSSTPPSGPRRITQVHGRLPSGSQPNPAIKAICGGTSLMGNEGDDEEDMQGLKRLRSLHGRPDSIN
uniref:Uncharacterized protein n=1 Tax=Fagus sylvatica TaxID=28930 RepID=A0A2N9I3H6_FAGSY